MVDLERLVAITEGIKARMDANEAKVEVKIKTTEEE
jgi:hypothetical protein